MCTIYKYIVIISHLARSVFTSFLLNLTTCCENTLRGERVDMSDWLSLSQKFGNWKPQHRIVFTTRRYRHITPPMDLARRNPVLAISSRISIYLSIYLSVCLSLRLVYHQRENSRARRPRRAGTHALGRTRWTLHFSVSPCPVARKYFLGSPLIYHNRRLSSRSRL